MPFDLTDYPQWQHLVDTKSSYRRAWLAGTFPVSDDPTGERTRRVQRPIAPRCKGVGDHMMDVTKELKLAMKQGCGCKSLATRMSRLGPEGCRRERASLVNDLKKNARAYTWGDVAKAATMALKTGLAWKIDLLDPYGSLLDEAVRRTELAAAQSSSRGTKDTERPLAHSSLE